MVYSFGVKHFGFFFVAIQYCIVGLHKVNISCSRDESIYQYNILFGENSVKHSFFKR